MIQTESTYLFPELMRASEEADLADPGDAARFATLLGAAADQLGLLFGSGSRQSYEAVQTIRLARDWVHDIGQNLPAMPPASALRLLGPYELMHRIARRRPAPEPFTDEILLKAFRARVRGDKTVDLYLLSRHIRDRIEKKRAPFLGAPLEWYMANLDRWSAALAAGVPAPSDRDTLERVSILMGENRFLPSGLDPERFRKDLWLRHRHLLDRLDLYGSDAREALSRFLIRSARYLTEEEYDAYDALLGRPFPSSGAHFP